MLKNLENEIMVSQLAQYEESDKFNGENITKKKKRKRTYDETDFVLISTI